MPGSYNRIAISWGALLLIAASLLLSGCSGDEQISPEDQIRMMLKAGEQAAESRSIKSLKPLISEKYSDKSGRVQKDVMQLAMGYFLRNKSIHLLTQIDRIDLLGEQHARVVLFAAMAGSPLEGMEQLLNLRADLHRFDLDVALEDEQWRIVGAQWKRAQPADFR